MAKKFTDHFTQVAEPMPECTECGNCGASGCMCALVKDQWWCMPCWSEGPGKHWPRKEGVVKDDWIDDDAKFRKRWEEGENHTKQIAERLRSDGLDVVEPEKSFRKTYADRGKYRDEIDLTVNGYRIEVKSRTKYWTSLRDYPFDSIFVDTVKKWDRHVPMPLATICVSQKTGAIIVIPAKTSGDWTRISGIDKDSKHNDEWYSAPNETWQTYEKLVSFLKKTGANEAGNGEG